MSRMQKKFPGRGLAAILGIVVVLALLFAIFGQNPGYDLYEPGPGMVVADKSSGRNTISYETAPQAPAADYGDSDDAAGYAVSDEAAYDGGMGYEQEAVKVEFSEALGEASLPADRKIIKEGSAYVETKDFDRSINAIDRIIAQSGGFAEKKDVRGNGYNTYDLRYATIVFRVPSQEFEAIMDNMGEVGIVTQSNRSGTDITDQYIDSETRLRNLMVQEETLLDILSKAEKLEDVITLESRIYEVRYEIETIENKLKNYDRLVQYSRISINLAEVVETTRKDPVPRTMGDRVTTAFSNAIDSFINGLENFMIWLVYNWILLAFILVLLIAFIIVVVIRKKRKKDTPAAVEAVRFDKDTPEDSEHQDK